MSFKDWLNYQKEDLDQRIRSYPRFRLLIFLVAIVGLIVSFWSLWGKTKLPAIVQIDTYLVDLIDRYKSLSLTLLFSIVSYMGNYVLVLISFVVVFVMVQKKRKRAAFITISFLIISYLLQHLIRNIFERPRPNGCLDSLFGQSCYSFPSGHSVASAYFYGLLTYLIFRFVPMSLKKFGLVFVCLVSVILLVGLSRVYLGVHYPSDVIAGYLFGVSWVLMAILLIDILY